MINGDDYERVAAAVSGHHCDSRDIHWMPARSRLDLTCLLLPAPIALSTQWPQHSTSTIKVVCSCHLPFRFYPPFSPTRWDRRSDSDVFISSSRLCMCCFTISVAVPEKTLTDHSV